jgi:hypothetical protein
MSQEMFSGWGVRTMSTSAHAYNPIGYHVGTVWPHDNSIIAAGLARYGYRHEAAIIAEAMIQASSFFDCRLPEAFAGFPRERTQYPAEYPTACSPQAWATGTPMLLLRTVLGLEPVGAILRSDPVLPSSIGHLSLRGIPGSWGTVDVTAEAADTIFRALGASADGAPSAVRELFAALDERVIPAARHDAVGSVRFDVRDSGTWHVSLKSGRVSVSQNHDDADVVFEMGEETLVGILNGTQNVRTAQLSGRMKVEGDMLLASRVMQAAAGAAAARTNGG